MEPPPDLGAVLQPVLQVSLDWTADKIEDAILTKARQIRLREVDNG